MAYPKLPPSLLWMLVLLGSCAVTVLLVIVIVWSMPPSKSWLGPAAEAPPDAAVIESEALVWPRAGTVMVMTMADGREMLRSLPAASWSVGEGVPFDVAIPANASEVTLRIVPRPGAIRDASLGVQFAGGQVLVRWGDRMVIADAAGAEPREAMTQTPLSMRAPMPPLSVTFRRSGEGAALLRMLWQPEGALYPMRLPSDGRALAADAFVRGHALAMEHRCTACHISDSLAAPPAARLAGLAHRVQESWLRAALAGEPEAMGSPPHRCSLAAQTWDAGAQRDLLHHLLSSSEAARPALASEPDLELGALRFHEVGCVACHGPLAPAEQFFGVPATGRLSADRYLGLSHVATKYTEASLTRYLADPLAVHPDGRMPSLDLSLPEAHAIAAYLMGDAAAEARTAAETFTIDPAAALRGAALYREASCTACHDAGGHSFPTQHAALHAIDPSAGGCLSESPQLPAPNFRFSNFERADLIAWIDALGGNSAPVIPAHDQLAAEMLRMRCTACHAYHADRGPEAAILAYFTSSEGADLGDEGRLPPELSDAGGRLTTAWMHQAFSGSDRARPWLVTRMPVYGDANTKHLPDLFAAVAGASRLLSEEPVPRATAVADGLRLVGIRGLNCIECHGVAGHPSVGMPGPDLTRMPERLHYSAFAQWMADPTLLRPGTRMPRFFTQFGSPVTDVCGGWPECQIESMWTYLALGLEAPLPEGFPDPAGFDLDVTDEPIVFRSFMQDAGFRAIAIGFPEGIHAAFDADRQAITAVWRGRFLSARGAWGGRGGMETNPDLLDWRLPPGQQMFTLLGADDRPVAEEEIVRRFLGYELDADRVPEFTFVIMHAEASATLRLRAAPHRERRGPPRMSVRVRIEGTPGMRVRTHAPGAAISLADPFIIELAEGRVSEVVLDIPE